MPTPAHTNFDPNKPVGSSTPTVFADTDLINNLRALRDMIVAGKAPGFIQTRTNGTGTANQPQFVTWLNGTIGFRWNITWTGNNPTTVVDEWSNDSGATWTAITSQVNTFDGSNNITASTNSGGFVTVLFELWGKLLKVISDFTTHQAATGTGVHGLGTASLANLASMIITGTSTFNGASIGDTAHPTIDGKRVREEFHDYGTILANATVTIEWDKYAHAAFTASATNTDLHTIAFSGLPAAGVTQSIYLEIINGQRATDLRLTYPAASKWVGGSTARPPDTSLQSAGRDFFVVTTRDNGTRLEWQYLGRGG